MDIPGFTESVKHSTTDRVSWQGSIQAYSEWKARFDGELAAAKKKEEDMARASKRGGQLTEEMEVRDCFFRALACAESARYPPPVHDALTPLPV